MQKRNCQVKTKTITKKNAANCETKAYADKKYCRRKDYSIPAAVSCRFDRHAKRCIMLVYEKLRNLQRISSTLCMACST